MFFWSSGVKETVPLVYTGCYGMNRDVLFTEGRAGLGFDLDVKLQLVVKAGQDWALNVTEWNRARTLCGLIPDDYGCKDVKIGDTPCIALVVRKVPSTVQAFFKDFTRGPLTRNLLAGVLDMFIGTMKQMGAYVGSEHQCKLAD